ncbi:MAG: MBL fold metallo-hydrolase [Desulfurococcales archaeon]|nr:MBL fold metallo-hydrolase [Desulfurococcales archaeon]
MVYLDPNMFIQIPLDPIGLKPSLSVYAIRSEDEWILVDAGPASTSRVLVSHLYNYGVKPSKIFLTHVHLDHMGASGDLLLEWPDAVFHVHPRGAPHLADPTKLWKQSREVLGWLANIFGVPKPVLEERIVELEDGSSIGPHMKVIHTPGHASHHASLFVEDMSILFPGTSMGLFMPVGNTSVYIPSLTYPLKLDLYIKSIEKQMNLEPQVVALAHFGVHDAGDVLNLAQSQLDEWIRVAGKSVEKGASTPEMMLSYMIKESDSVRRAWEYSVRYDPLIEKIMFVVAKGLYEHITS